MRRPGWVLLALIAIAMSVLFVFLGRWQWHRHEDRRERNAAIAAALATPPVPIDEVLPAGATVTAREQFRVVELTGSYDAAHQVLQRNPNGRSGFAVVTPLVTDSGFGLLIDRGWTPPSTTDISAPAADVSPPSGEVHVVVRLLAADDADDRTAPEGQIYAVDPSELAQSLPYPIYDGYGDLVEQDPPPSEALELPDTDVPGMGPNLFYAYQWWIFAVIAIGGFVVLARREAQGDQSQASDQVDAPNAV